MTSIVLSPRVENPGSDTESIVSSGWWQIRPSKEYQAGGQWVQPVWTPRARFTGVAVTMLLDPLPAVPYELYMKIPDGTGGWLEVREFRIVTDSGSPLAWDSLVEVAGPGGESLPTNLIEARVAALEATFPSGGASTLAGITDMSAAARTFNTQTTTANMRSNIGAAPTASPTFTTALTAANPTFTGTVTVPAGSVSQASVTNLTTDLAAKAPLASPALTGTPTAPTATAGTNTTQVATTAFVATAVGGGGSVADATSGVKGIVQLAGDLAGTAAAPTVPGKANIASPTFTGAPAAPTAATGTSTTQLATTAFVQAHTAWAYGIQPRVVWSGSTWPTRASVNSPGYTGAVEYWSPYDASAPAPTDRVLNDLWTRKRT